MNNTHVITVTGRQHLNGTEDRQQFRTYGRRMEKDGALLIIYDEMQEGGAVVRVSLKLSGHRAVMIRNGAGQSRMEFDPDRTTYCSYDTGAGILPLEIRTQTVSHQSDIREERIRLNYTLYYDGEVLSHNQVTIRLAPIAA
ncbi:MAG: DUF1934 domain-containing protein [Clostridia bacterium]|nr:DUF1934 domain-containing protein [Clostridia bacterium]